MSYQDKSVQVRTKSGGQLLTMQFAVFIAAERDIL